ncbi:MAG: hypothetical protein KC516_00325 [Nanoarchaeota archaeon]|nr:hypothetical protein [Nanoarchaeota archaeon]
MVRDKKKWEETKKEFKKDLENPLLWGYFLIMIVLAILFSVKKDEDFRLISLVIFIVLQTGYLIFLSKKGEKRLNWIYLILFVFYLIIYFFAINKNISALTISVLAFVFLAVGWLWGISYTTLKDKRIPLIVSYIVFVGASILFFSLIFSVFNASLQNKILDPDGRQIQGMVEYVWFSAGNFYMNNFGEKPYGMSKSFSYFEMAFSLIIHTIIISREIERRKR